jgi:hypothetical protein
MQPMSRLVRFAVVALVAVAGYVAFVLHARATFPGDRTPEGAYVRIVVALSEGRPRDCFAYLETRAQWACHTIRDYRSKAAERIARAYPEPDRSVLLREHEREAKAPDGADIWVGFAEQRGWLQRLRKDLSGIARLEIAGERATVETARGTRYAFRRRDNGIWGLTIFTGELVAEAEKAARDYEMVDKAARDYEHASPAGTP